MLHQAGRGLVCEPIGLAALSAFALAETPGDGSPHPLLEKVMGGSLLIVPALQETPHGGGALSPTTRAEAQGAGVTVSGQQDIRLRRRCRWLPGERARTGRAHAVPRRAERHRLSA